MVREIYRHLSQHVWQPFHKAVPCSRRIFSDLEESDAARRKGLVQSCAPSLRFVELGLLLLHPASENRERSFKSTTITTMPLTTRHIHFVLARGDKEQERHSHN